MSSKEKLRWVKIWNSSSYENECEGFLLESTMLQVLDFVVGKMYILVPTKVYSIGDCEFYDCGQVCCVFYISEGWSII